jgi:hypothetical protein
MNLSAFFSTPIEGIQAATSKLERHAEALAAARLRPEEFIGVIESKRAAEVNLAVLKAENETADALLNVLA